MSDIETFGFENEDIKGGIYEKFKGKKGEINRCGIIYTDPKAMFAGSKVHFKDRYFLCKKSICCDKCGPAKYRIGAAIVKYATDKMGQLKKPFAYEIYPWMFSEQIFIKLKSLNTDFPLATHDIKISCTNEEYQHLDITPCNESAWQLKEEVKKDILDHAKPIWEYVKKSIASDLSIEEIKDLLGMTPTVGSDPSQTVDLDQVMNNL